VKAKLIESNEPCDSRYLLDMAIAPAGANLSAGERQLVCLARAIVRQSPVIISDEATSSVDHATDRQLQSAIKDNFENSCLITIAHRISSCIEYDKVLVLDQGILLEE
jgi:ATP-binding cassette, subfamily C (CFTR/MRP), member 4